MLGARFGWMFVDSGEYMNMRGIPTPAGRWRGDPPPFYGRFPCCSVLGDGRGGVANEQARHTATGEDEATPGD